MKRLVLIMALILVPLVVIGGATNNKTWTRHSAYFNSGWILDTATGTRWRNVAEVSERPDGTYYVNVFRQCHYFYGTCTGYDTYGCYTYYAGKDVVLVANKNKIVLDLQPEDCQNTHPFGPIPVQVVWQASGIDEYSEDYTNYRRRWEGPQGEQCFYRSDTGSYERRSADVEGIWGDTDASGTSDIQVRNYGHYVSNCSH